MTSVLTDTIPGIRVIKSFTNEKNAVDYFSEKVEDYLLAAGVTDEEIATIREILLEEA